MYRVLAIAVLLAATVFPLGLEGSCGQYNAQVVPYASASVRVLVLCSLPNVGSVC